MKYGEAKASLGNIKKRIKCCKEREKYITKKQNETSTSEKRTEINEEMWFFSANPGSCIVSLVLWVRKDIRRKTGLPPVMN